jgi:hypothetical protein
MMLWLDAMASAEEKKATDKQPWVRDQWVPVGDESVTVVGDNLAGHKTKAVLRKMREYKLHHAFTMAYWSRYMSPVDNGFNAAFRRRHVDGLRTPGSTNVGAVVRAYFGVPDSTIFNSFHAAGWHDYEGYDDNPMASRRLGRRRSASSIVRAWAEIGYIGAGGHRVEHEAAIDAYDAWSNGRYRDEAVALRHHVVLKLPDRLDGVRSNVYGRGLMSAHGQAYDGGQYEPQ